MGWRVWIVGASTGIGAATARLLASRGARLALSARNEALLREAVPGALVLPLDVTDAAALDTAARRIVAELGRIDLVMLNAGTYTPMRAWEFNPASVAPRTSNSMGRAASACTAITGTRRRICTRKCRCSAACCVSSSRCLNRDHSIK